jgi:hypothetical protein
MAKSLILLALFCSNTFAYTTDDNKSVVGIIRDCSSMRYSDSDCMEAILSNTYTVPEAVICTYLPRLEGCL